MKKIIFVCLGNICRSTMAEALAKNAVQKMGRTGEFAISSRATGSHTTGWPPDARTQAMLTAHGVPELVHQAGKISDEDFHDADLIIGMDHSNIKNLQKLAPAGTADKIHLLLPGEEIPDPYLTGDFAETYRLLQRGLPQWLD